MFYKQANISYRRKRQELETIQNMQHSMISNFVLVLNYTTKIITRSIFFKILMKNTHARPLGRGVFCGFNSDLYSASTSAVMFTISYHIGPRYTDILLYLGWFGFWNLRKISCCQSYTPVVRYRCVCAVDMVYSIVYSEFLLLYDIQSVTNSLHEIRNKIDESSKRRCIRK